MDYDDGLTTEERATNYATMRHIEQVRKFITMFVKDLLDRADEHDQSKLAPPEVGPFTEFTPRLAKSDYGSPEYEEFRKQLGPALDHHYAKNRHHPEHFPECDDGEVARIEELLDEAKGACGKGSIITAYLEEQLKIAKSSVNRMNLLDIVECFCDWKAASLRHDTGNIRKSIEVNTERFGLSQQVAKILENTVDFLDE